MSTKWIDLILSEREKMIDTHSLRRIDGFSRDVIAALLVDENKRSSSH